MYDVWCMMYDVWCLMFDVWCTMYDDVWCMMYDVWCMMYDVWCMMYDVWCMMYDVWCMMYDVWCMMYDVWCMMYDVWWCMLAMMIYDSYVVWMLIWFHNFLNSQHLWHALNSRLLRRMLSDPSPGCPLRPRCSNTPPWWPRCTDPRCSGSPDAWGWNMQWYDNKSCYLTSTS